MSVSVPCPHPACGQSVEVAETALGSEVRCPHCGQAFAARQNADPYATVAPPPPEATDADAHQTAAPEPAAASASLFDAALADDGKAALPKCIGRFEVQACLGEGAFGRVYRAHDPQLDRAVAVKVAKPNALLSQAHVERFLREARGEAQLRHPNIVPVFDAGEADGHYYIASAFIAGRTLEATMAKERRDYRRAAQVVRQLAEALAYAHGEGIVHRDVKPANVMIEEGERGGVSAPRAMLMDFGLAARREGGERLTHEGAILGTPLYGPGTGRRTKGRGGRGRQRSV